MKEDGHRVVPVQNNLRRKRPGATALAALRGHGHLRRLPAHIPLVARHPLSGDTDPPGIYSPRDLNPGHFSRVSSENDTLKDTE